MNHALENRNWGIKLFDEISGGLPAGLLSVVETPDYHTGNIILGQFLYEGLVKGERCVLITFDSGPAFLENFALWDLDFKKFLLQDQFYILNYRPNIAFEIGLSHDYGSVLQEIEALCGGSMPSRIAIQQVDTLINLNNSLLINASAQKLSAATRTTKIQGPTVLGQFVHFEDQIHHDLSVALQKTVPGYFSLTQPDPLIPTKYYFQAKKLPWFSFVRQPTLVHLQEGEGFTHGESVRKKVA